MMANSNAGSDVLFGDLASSFMVDGNTPHLGRNSGAPNQPLSVTTPPLSDASGTNNGTGRNPPGSGTGIADSGIVRNHSASPSVPGSISNQFFGTDAINWAFQNTPPYDCYSERNPFDGLSDGLPTTSQSSWNMPYHFMAGNPNGGVDASGAVTSFNSCTELPGNYPMVRPNVTSEVLTTLTHAQQETLRSIAMPSHFQYRLPGSPESNSSTNERKHNDESSSPGGCDLSKAVNRKRKSSADVEDDEYEEDFDGHHPVKKTAHNMIEKRYRTNLNDKIAALRDSVPALRIMSKSARGEDTTEDREELHGLTPAHKLNKATVLSKATEYIRHLEKRNNRLVEENNNMHARIAAFEKLFMAGAFNRGMPHALQQPPNPIQFTQDAQSSYLTAGVGASRGPDPPGIMPIPDEMKSILAAQQVAAGRPYAMPAQIFPQNPAMLRQQQIQQQQQAQNRSIYPGVMGKLMVGSLAGLMCFQAAVEKERSNEMPQGRGLLAIGIPGHIDLGGHSWSTHQIWLNFQMIISFFAMTWAFSSFFMYKGLKARKNLHASLEAVPSLASPLHIRRQAWLTAIQTVWVPTNSLMLELAALSLKFAKFSIRNLIGFRGYQLLTGLTEEQEAARVKAWIIALDAQLAGGDREINRSRLMLTWIASYTLPMTAPRRMLNALHLRVLLWHGKETPSLLRMAAAKWARSIWNDTRQQNRLLQELRRRGASLDEALPEHLSLLLERDCDQVLSDEIIQRAHNLAWNRPTDEHTFAENGGMDAVVEDSAVKSPLDAIAAWYSSALVQRLLSRYLDRIADGEDDAAAWTRDAKESLTCAIRLAPIGSNAQLRALAARAVVLDDRRGAYIAAVIAAKKPEASPDKPPQFSKGLSPLIDSPMTCVASDADVEAALRCAMAIAQLRKHSHLPSVTQALIQSCIPKLEHGNLSLLGFASTFQVMNVLDEHAAGRETCSGSLEALAGTLRLWVGSAVGEKTGLDDETRRAMVDRCIGVARSVVGMKDDPGYVSMSECDDNGRSC